MIQTSLSNHTILQQKTLLGLSEGAGKAYLDFLDKCQARGPGPRELAAFREACRYEVVGHVIDRVLNESPARVEDPVVRKSLSDFLAARYIHNFARNEHGVSA